ADAVLDLAEVMPIEQDDLAQDERRLPLRDHFARERDRTDLLIAHDASFVRDQPDASADFAPASPFVALVRQSPRVDARSKVPSNGTGRRIGETDMQGTSQGTLHTGPR